MYHIPIGTVFLKRKRHPVPITIGIDSGSNLKKGLKMLNPACPNGTGRFSMTLNNE